MLKLHHYWSSVCSQKVRAVLAEKRQDWQSAHTDLFEFEQLRPDYLKLNPKGLVPTLEHDGFVLTESNVICEYLDETFTDPPLSPREPRRRAAMRRWMTIIEEDLHPPIATVSFNTRHRTRMLKKHSVAEIGRMLTSLSQTELAANTVARLESGMPPEAEEAAFRKIAKIMDWFEAGLAPGPWLLGESYCLADITLRPYVNRIDALTRPELVGPAQRPRIAQWWQRIQALPSVQTAMSFRNPDTSDLIAR
jgi:glutathione S-transferase